MKKKIAIIVLVVLVLCIMGIIVYQNVNKELLVGCYFKYDDNNNESCLEIREDGTFDFLVSVDTCSIVKGTYKMDGKYLILTTTYNKEIKFEIGYKKIYVVDSGVYDDLLLEGMKYKWCKGTMRSFLEQHYSE